MGGAFRFRAHAASGWLNSYGPKTADLFFRAAFPVDGILRVEKRGDVTVQAPTECEPTINLAAAQTLDITLPRTILVPADEVIE